MSFDDFFTIFFVVIAGFIVFGVVNMLARKRRWADEKRQREERLAAANAKRETSEPGPGSTAANGATHSTFGTSGIGPSDTAVAGMYGTAGAAFADAGSDSGDAGGDGRGDGGSDAGGGWND
jgi:hypothetical protein